jgi:hypothetical protein
MITRKAYVLTCNPDSERSKFSKSVLEHVGFQVIFFRAIPNENKILSNKISMMAIYDIISKGDDDWAYVFEDDINILEDIKLQEIVKYEKISSVFFYLGLCDYGPPKLRKHKMKINNKPVTIVKGNIKGLHAIGISKYGAGEFQEFARLMPEEDYMDVCLEKFSIKHPANVVRYDLESYIYRHRGIFFQDRKKFPTTI